MKVMIHALGATMGGAERHLTNFLPELDKVCAHHDISVMLRDSFSTPTGFEHIRILKTSDAVGEHAVKRLGHDLILLPKILKRENFDVVVSLTNFGPIWAPIPHILFQRNPIYYCPYYLSKIQGLARLEVQARRALAIQTMKRATVVVTPTNAMAAMIKGSCSGLEDVRFRTIHHGFSVEAMGNESNEAISKYLSYSGIKLLYPTHAALHKGFDMLLGIILNLVKVEKLNIRLITTVSDEDWPAGVSELRRSIARHGLEDRFLLIGRVPQRQMAALYRGCHLMIYPSLCESFGFSMVEAMGSELPIVAADTAVNREICGNAALFYSPLDAAGGAKSVVAALDPSMHKALKKRAQSRLGEFDWSWSRYAREFIALLGSI